MRADIKKEWTEALRSDKFKQCKGRLKKVFGGPTRHCCLGVLCEIKNLEESERIIEGSEYINFKMNDESSFSDLPNVFAEYVGIPVLKEQMLMKMNDEGKSFNEIADWIEENL